MLESTHGTNVYAMNVLSSASAPSDHSNYGPFGVIGILAYIFCECGITDTAEHVFYSHHISSGHFYGACVVIVIFATLRCCKCHRYRRQCIGLQDDKSSLRCFLSPAIAPSAPDIWYLANLLSQISLRIYTTTPTLFFELCVLSQRLIRSGHSLIFSHLSSLVFSDMGMLSFGITDTFRYIEP